MQTAAGSCLTDRGERLLFGLEAPEVRKGASMRPGGAGGDLTCALCGKKGLTGLGLKLHTARMHKAELEKEEAFAKRTWAGVPPFLRGLAGGAVPALLISH